MSGQPRRELLAGVIAVMLATCLTGCADPAPPDRLLIATGNPGGVYYALGEALAGAAQAEWGISAANVETAASVAVHGELYTERSVPATTYRLGTEVGTIGVGNLLVVRADLPAPTAYAITKLLFDARPARWRRTGRRTGSTGRSAWRPSRCPCARARQTTSETPNGSGPLVAPGYYVHTPGR